MNHSIDGSGGVTLDGITTLARTIYGEARDDGDKGMVAVAFVIRNRLWDDGWPSSIKGVCLQPLQFSCWNRDDSNKPVIDAVTMDDPAFLSAMTIAFQMISGYLNADPTNGANHYMTTELYYGLRRPLWANELRVVAEIGRHVFLAGMYS